MSPAVYTDINAVKLKNVFIQTLLFNLQVAKTVFDMAWKIFFYHQNSFSMLSRWEKVKMSLTKINRSSLYFVFVTQYIYWPTTASFTFHIFSWKSVYWQIRGIINIYSFYRKCLSTLNKKLYETITDGSEIICWKT